MDAGSISDLYRYPIKSALGESCEQVTVDQRGFQFDRLFALSNTDGKFGSHKNTRRFRKINGLFDLRASVRAGVVWVSFPDGSELKAHDPQIHEKLTDVSGEPVTLVAEESISHFDDGAIHILTSTSLSWLQSKLPDSIIDIRRFRPNIVIDCAGNGLSEKDWIGRLMRIGTCEFEVTAETARCVMTGLSQDNLRADPEITTAISRLSNNHFGVYAKVLRSGTISVNDQASILG